MAPRPTPKLRPIRKSWQKGLASIPLLDGKRRKVDDNRYVIKDIPVGRNEEFDLTPDTEQQLARVLGDGALAHRLVKLKAEFPYGTFLELVVYEFLQKNLETFLYQIQLFGGHRSGGQVIDFVVQYPGGWIGLAAQGWYWHNVPGKQEKDEAARQQALGTYYEGRVIREIVWLWENQVMQPNPMRESVLEDALVGIEHPG